jgi:hypothetical protein
MLSKNLVPVLGFGGRGGGKEMGEEECLCVASSQFVCLWVFFR